MLSNLFLSNFDKEMIAGYQLDIKLINDMSAILAQQIRDMEIEPEDKISHNGVQLILLGTTDSWMNSVDAGNIKCNQAAYLGANGRIYVERPRKTITGSWIIQIKPYDLEYAARRIDFDELSPMTIAAMLAPYFI